MKRSISRHLVSTHPSSSSAGSVAEGTIACAICQAVYAPSRLHAYLLQASPIALESAFMSMCHFCFRCRRASCPNCWDHVHGICAQCTQETHVPFRTETPPVTGIASLPQHSSSSIYSQTAPTSLVKVEPGRFQIEPSSFIESAATRPDPPSPTSAQKVVVSPSVDIDRIKTRPDRSASLNIDEVATRPDRHNPLDVDKITTRPERGRLVKSKNIVSHTKRPIHRRRERVRIFLSLVLALLLLIVLVVVASLLSGEVNLFLSHVLHIDIQATATSLWHFLRNLFS